MLSIEAELHQMLEEIAPDHDVDEQARIVAEAAAIYEKTSRRMARTSQKQHVSRIREAQMTDALLQAMGTMADWSDEDAPTFIDGRGLDPGQIVHRAAHMKRGASEGWGEMDILDPDLDAFLASGDDEITYHHDDSEDAHPEDLYFTPGRPRHRSDSQVRTSD